MNRPQLDIFLFERLIPIWTEGTTAVTAIPLLAALALVGLGPVEGALQGQMKGQIEQVYTSSLHCIRSFNELH